MRSVRWALWLARHGCGEECAEEVEGDLLEIASRRGDGPAEATGRGRSGGFALLREALIAVALRPSARLRLSAIRGVFVPLVAGLVLVVAVIARGNPEPPVVYWLLGVGVLCELGLWLLIFREVLRDARRA